MSSPQPAAGRGKKRFLIVLVAVGMLSVGAGVAAPILLRGSSPKQPAESAPPAEAYIPFEDVTANLGQGNLTRYLRVKIVVVTDKLHEKGVADAIEHKKAPLRSWLIAHLADKDLADVAGRVAINRLRFEIREHFVATLFPHEDDAIRDILFEEFLVQ